MATVMLANIRISRDVIRALTVVGCVIGVYFFAFQMQKFFAHLMGAFARRFGEKISSQEYKLQRYVFQHSKSPISSLYRWINKQLIALGLKRSGVTPFGYLLFWLTSSLILVIVLEFVMRLVLSFMIIVWLVLFIGMLIMTRVFVSSRLERREMEVMDAIDLIVPEIYNGTKNAIVTYQDSFSPGVRDDFKAFISNIQDRGFSFEAAMYVLADNLGEVFQDFAEKSIYYEKMGERDLLDIFTDIVETNRLRRQLRESNTRKFRELVITFVVSCILAFAYFLFIIFTDQFSRVFLLTSFWGNMILLIDCIIVFGVMAYITSIKSGKI